MNLSRGMPGLNRFLRFHVPQQTYVIQMSASELSRSTTATVGSMSEGARDDPVEKERLRKNEVLVVGFACRCDSKA